MSPGRRWHRRQEIEQASSIRIDDLLRGVPGVDLALGSSTVQYPTQQTISMRGLGVNRALVLLDGIPLNDPVSGYAPVVESSQGLDR